MNSLIEDECASVHCPAAMMYSFRCLALSGFEMEVLQRYDFVHDEHGAVYAHLETKGEDAFIRIRGAAFDCILRYMGLSEGLCLDDDEIDELATSVEDFIQTNGELIENADIVEMMAKAA